MLEQYKNRLKEVVASLNVQARKQRTRRLIELGGLVAKAQLDLWNTNALLGGLLFLKEKESDTKQVESWAQKGCDIFAASTKDAALKSPVIVTFTSKPNEDLRLQLKHLGLKWNSLRGEWEGYVDDVSALTDLLRGCEAVIRKIRETDEEAQSPSHP